MKHRQVKVEKEVKFKVTDISSTLNKIRRLASFDESVYIRDIIYGSVHDKKKIRLRVEDDFERSTVELIYKHRAVAEDGVKTEIEETLYTGPDIDAALTALKKQGDFVEENSYEKIRTKFVNDSVEITLDAYPYGVWLEIEGATEEIWKIAGQLGYTTKDAITMNADELYLEWNKKFSIKEFWDVRFGLTGKK